jgi:hypothetical protein
VSDFSVTAISTLKRDLALRGYNEGEIDELLHTPILFIPGPITPQDQDEPAQKLTSHIAFISKELKREGILNRVAVRKDVPRKYLEERHAHIDLGTVVLSIWSAQQIGAFANIAQVLDFLLNLIQFRFGSGRTAELMPNVKFDLEIHNSKNSARVRVEGAADAVAKIVTPKRLEAMLSSLKESPKDG